MACTLATALGVGIFLAGLAWGRNERVTRDPAQDPYAVKCPDCKGVMVKQGVGRYDCPCPEWQGRVMKPSFFLM